MTKTLTVTDFGSTTPPHSDTTDAVTDTLGGTMTAVMTAVVTSLGSGPETIATQTLYVTWQQKSGATGSRLKLIQGTVLLVSLLVFAPFLHSRSNTNVAAPASLPPELLTSFQLKNIILVQVVA